ncbi:hypothetical protein [Fluviicola chungangensis]|uniref:Uncharacterized protein n=1 Tax=Fluviicola chungangensis TaxID=2597671 RepID=A0A556N2P4_9FLAO|nr:hypothetical protein [Fluviicola chungangensis]TSJ46345.1 hypothetical protein FO442_04085 [Fluviicola chungangensis]
MVRLIIPVLLLSIAACSDSKSVKSEKNPFKTEQLYKGYSNSGGYLCCLKITPDNMVLFTYETAGNSIYGEHSGTIKAINDSTYHVNCKLTFGQYICKAPTLDSLTIFVDPSAALDKKSILVQYGNDDLMKLKRIDKSKLTFAFDDQLFNEYTPATILTDHTHPLTGELLTIKASFGSAYDFVQGDEVDFDIVISGDSLYTIKEDAVFQTGSFRLKKQKSWKK